MDPFTELGLNAYNNIHGIIKETNYIDTINTMFKKLYYSNTYTF